VNTTTNVPEVCSTTFRESPRDVRVQVWTGSLPRVPRASEHWPSPVRQKEASFHTRHQEMTARARSIWKMLGPFATASRRTPSVLHCHSPGVTTVARRHCRTLPAHRCPQQHRQQRQRVTEGTAMASWNGPNNNSRYASHWLLIYDQLDCCGRSRRGQGSLLNYWRFCL